MADAALDEGKITAEIGKHLADRDWRIDNLYSIRNEDGQVIPFRRNDAQVSFDQAMWYRNVIPKARKLGFSTFIGMFTLDECLFVPGTVAGVVDKTLPDAEDKLAMIALGYEKLAPEIRALCPLIRQADRYMEWKNGSSISAGLTYRGGTPRILHVSEYGKIAVDSPNQAHEIKTGAIQAVPQSGIVFVESTAHGTAGEFCDMVRTAEARRISGQKLTRLDFKSQFFGWMHKREYRLPYDLVIITKEVRDYFAELKARHGIKVDAEQMAWYCKKLEELGPDDIKQEFPSVPDELFYSAIQGAYWRRELTKARAEGRVGGLVPHDPSRRVNTFWDIGEDCTAIIFHQTDGLRHRFIDYYEEEGGSIQRAAAVLDEKRRERGFIYDKHYGPHDFENRDWGNNANSRKAIAKGLGLDITVVPRIDDKADSIEAARRMINMSWFDQQHCSRLVEAMENYRKKWNERQGIFMPEPVHDWASHPSDAFQQGAMGLRPEGPKRGNRDGRHVIGGERKATTWAA